MKYFRLIGMLCGLAASAAPAAHAWDSDTFGTFIDQGRAATSLDIENDTLLLTGSDRFYTSGLRLSRSYHMRTEDGWESLGWRFGQQLYTPSAIQRRPEQLAPLDHPYAGWLYAGLFHRLERADGRELAFGLDLGCLGPCAGGEGTQDKLHRVFNQPRPQGWSSQIGTEAGVVLHAGARGALWRVGPYVDLRPGVALRLGNIFTDISAEATLRAGKLQRSAQASTYGFVRMAVRAVAHDATLQGGWISGTDARTVHPKRFTGEVELGLQWQNPQWVVRVSAVRRGNEIEGLSESYGRQDFLRLSLVFMH